MKGRVRVGKRTKDLVKRIEPGEWAVIDHLDLDEVAAWSLVERKVKAVLNASSFISGRYPNPGPGILLKHGIFLMDNLGKEIMELLKDGDYISIIGNNICKEKVPLAQGTVLSSNLIELKMQQAKNNLKDELDKFIANTLEYAAREKDVILNNLALPSIKTDFSGRHVLIVVRGKNYKEDLRIIKPYINEVKPILIGVDGGGDVLWDAGYHPDIIIGDMDSVKDKTLKVGAELIVHAYPDGRAPGLPRLESLGLSALTFPAPGTSEDIAMLLAYEKGASLIVAVGTHTSMLDFLEKGRKGMASTFLVRLKVGSILVDAKGVSQLYTSKGIKPKDIAFVFAAALLPMFLILDLAPATQQILRLLSLKVRFILGW